MTIPQASERIAFQHYKANWKIDTLPSKEEYDFIKSSVFGGNCQVFHRQSFCSAESIVFSLDANNLYGKALKMLIPTKFVRVYTDALILDELLHWLKRKDGYSRKYIDGNLEKVEFGGFVRCHTYFTKEQKERCKRFPPHPQRMITDPFYEELMQEISLGISQIEGKKHVNSEKVCYTFFPNNDFCVSTAYLKFLCENDLISVACIHEWHEYKHEYVFRDFIDAMTEKRQKAENMIALSKKKEVKNMIAKGNGVAKEYIKVIELIELMKRRGLAEKARYKLLNNSLYGRTLMDTTGRTSAFFVCDEEGDAEVRKKNYIKG